MIQRTEILQKPTSLSLLECLITACIIEDRPSETNNLLLHTHYTYYYVILAVWHRNIVLS